MTQQTEKVEAIVRAYMSIQMVSEYLGVKKSSYKLSEKERSLIRGIFVLGCLDFLAQLRNYEVTQQEVVNILRSILSDESVFPEGDSTSLFNAILDAASDFTLREDIMAFGAQCLAASMTTEGAGNSAYMLLLEDDARMERIMSVLRDGPRDLSDLGADDENVTIGDTARWVGEIFLEGVKSRLLDRKDLNTKSRFRRAQQRLFKQIIEVRMKTVPDEDQKQLMLAEIEKTDGVIGLVVTILKVEGDLHKKTTAVMEQYLDEIAVVLRDVGVGDNSSLGMDADAPSDFLEFALKPPTVSPVPKKKPRTKATPKKPAPKKRSVTKAVPKKRSPKFMEFALKPSTRSSAPKKKPRTKAAPKKRSPKFMEFALKPSTRSSAPKKKPRTKAAPKQPAPKPKETYEPKSRWFSVIWGVIFALVGIWLIGFSNGFVIFLGFLSLVMAGMSALQFFEDGKS